MKAIRIDGKTPGGDRTKLSKVIPLETPYMVQLFPVYGCNFKCNYCIHSVPLKGRGYISEETYMDFDIYKKIIDDLSEFPQRIKMLRFAGTGEPLLHRDIAEMVEYAVKKQVADSIDIVTNGSLLTKELSRKIIKANLPRLRISIQGINSLEYKKTIGTNFDFDKFIENLTYFYENKGETQIYIKIIDCALQKDEENRFFEIFGNICDTIAIEHLLPAVSQIDYTTISNSSTKLAQNGGNVQDVEVCPQPFYLMQINPEGNVVPCCAMETVDVAGNCKEDTLYNIWNGKKYNDFRKTQLAKQKEIYSVCSKCKQYKYAMFSEDILDNDAERLLNLFK
ncbi:radical SAM protein [Clostridium estertheticum]|uniref:radical SAM/SPASM domain-containing protein n=1 Tax=Clostridium estertheticum TaxID=238834 RepID=UPI001C0E684A|nr:radical SAM protein [Clostridium estertheticum]MBU3176433.1 radical SAM protein [Clostridium estertheticum]